MYSLICQSSEYYRMTCGDATSSKKCWFEHVVSSFCIVGEDVCERTGMLEWLNCHTFACQDVFFNLSILRRYRMTCGDATSSKKCWFEHVVSSLCIVGGHVCERMEMLEWLNCHTFACQDVFFNLSILRRYRMTCGDATSSKKCWFEHVVSSLCIVGGDVCERTGMLEWLNCHTFACQDVFFNLSILRIFSHDLWRCNIL